MVFFGHYRNRPVVSGEKNTGKKCALYDGLAPYTIAQQVDRFVRAGQVLESTRRRELMALRDFVDDPESVETFMDSVGDLAEFKMAVSGLHGRLPSAEPEAEDQKPGDQPVVKPETKSGEGSTRNSLEKSEEKPKQ